MLLLETTSNSSPKLTQYNTSNIWSSLPINWKDNTSQIKSQHTPRMVRNALECTELRTTISVLRIDELHAASPALHDSGGHLHTSLMRVAVLAPYTAAVSNRYIDISHHAMAASAGTNYWFHMLDPYVTVQIQPANSNGASISWIV